MRLKNKVAIVTGASKGIGAGIALRLGEEGVKVAVFFNTDSAGASKVAEKIKSTGGVAITKQGDVTKYKQMEKAFAEVHELWGSIDILVNNAGVATAGLFIGSNEAEWDTIIGVDFKGVFICSHICLKYMIKQNSGKIINIASDTAREGEPTLSVYSGAKGAIISSSKSLAKELARYNINVNVISPGLIETPMTNKDKVAIQTEEVKEIVENAIKRIPLRRLGQPSEVGDLAVFFASEDSKYITGQVLSINGGLTMIG